ncbi:hypothetical protein [Streptomyces justiciae]|uniref:Uncharacterized protein n=1 Tax=Streptomyces justiciae TaxID=2780140 RepID=A0ABU3M3D4_9ACTN|nr:hypothetical protein [Streptomyces justiciae]MBE8478293.1 hypothetical protein [Streptomyces justiciae]MCW8375682.1 hypothetical protein [Streptomyces justiciae]MDT7845903.1 hypothetical protein [Streptomyces justiciae]
MKHSTNQQTRRGRGPARRIGRTLALVLPVFLVLSGTLAVTRVNWTGSPSDSVLTASDISAARAKARAPQDVLRDKLLAELQEENPGIALTHLQEAVNDRPSLAKHCASIARALGRAAVRVYGPTRAQSYARPVCDTSFATGVAASHN